MIKNKVESTGDVCENCSSDEYCELQNIIQKYQPIEWEANAFYYLLKIF